jgi:hypothetical protein
VPAQPAAARRAGQLTTALFEVFGPLAAQVGDAVSVACWLGVVWPLQVKRILSVLVRETRSGVPKM